MGYTHYFKLKKLSKANFDKVAKDVKIIETALKGMVPLTNNTNDKVIDLNGVGANQHENLWLEKSGDGFNFCKTARKPYDIAICLALLSLKFHATNTEISSDGDNEEWALPFKMYKDIFPEKKVSFDMSGEDLEMIKTVEKNYKK